MNENIKNKLINNNFFKTFILNRIKIHNIYLGGSRVLGLNETNSDYDVIIYNEDIDDFWFSLYIDDIKIDLIFIKDLYSSLTFFDFTKLYLFLSGKIKWWYKDIILNKEKIKKGLISKIKSYKNYLLKPKEHRKLNYHLCVAAQILKGEKLNKEAIMECKYKKVINNFCKEQFEYLLNLCNEKEGEAQND